MSVSHGEKRKTKKPYEIWPKAGTEKLMDSYALV
jgi:hypothetical protein